MHKKTKAMTMKLKTVIIEDELLSREALATVLKTYCFDETEIVGSAESVKEAIRLIKATNPKLLFLDIKLNAEDDGAFQILKALPRRDFQVIFTTSSDNADKILTAVNKYGAIKYLLKPVDIDQVIEGVHSAVKKLNEGNFDDRLDNLGSLIQDLKKSPLPNDLNNLNAFLSLNQSTPNSSKIKIPIKSGSVFIPASDIIMIRSSRNHSVFFTVGKDTIESTHLLKYFAEAMPQPDFFRTGKQYIVNLHHIEKILNTDKEIIYLSNKCEASLSSNERVKFYAALHRILGNRK